MLRNSENTDLVEITFVQVSLQSYVTLQEGHPEPSSLTALVIRGYANYAYMFLSTFP